MPDAGPRWKSLRRRGDRTLPRLQPAAQALGVGRYRWEWLCLFFVRCVHRIQLGAERFLKCLADVSARLPGALRHLGPPAQARLSLPEDLVRIGEQPKVGQSETGRGPGREAAQGRDGKVQVEVGRWSGRAQHTGIREAYAHGVAHEQDAALGVVKAHVMLGVARRFDRREGPSRSDPKALTVREDVDAIGRGRLESTVEAVQERTVDTGSGGNEARGVGQVSGPLLVYIDLRLGRPWPDPQPHRRDRDGCG